MNFNDILTIFFEVIFRSLVLPQMFTLFFFFGEGPISVINLNIIITLKNKLYVPFKYG